MYAVFNACGKQYKVKKGDTLRLELLPEGLGATKSFTEILLVGEGAEVKIGQPFVSNASVTAEIVSLEKGPKIDIMHKKRRKQFKRHVGHRQPYTRILITEVKDGAKAETLSQTERDEIMKRVGFAARDEFKPSVLDEAAKAKKAEKLKARSEKQKAKATDAKTEKPAAKKSAKKISAKKVGAKRKAAAKKKAMTKKSVAKADKE